MKALVAACAIVALAPLLPAQQQPPPRPAQGSIEDIVEGFYVSRLQTELELDDEQFVKVLPLLHDSLRGRKELGRKRVEAIKKLQRVLDASTSDGEIEKQIRNVDQTDRDAQSVHQRFLESADPHLTLRQRAQLRVFQVRIDQRIRGMIDRSRGLTRPDRGRILP